MQKSGILQPTDVPIGHRIDYALTPGGTLSQFRLVLGFLYGATDDELGIFLFPTTIGLLSADIGIGVGNDWAFVKFSDVITWYQRDEVSATYRPFQTDIYQGGL